MTEADCQFEEMKRRATEAGLLDTTASVDTLRISSGTVQGADMLGGQTGLPRPGAGKALLRLESDGTANGTRVWLGDTQVAYLQGVKWEIDTESPIGKVTISALTTDTRICKAENDAGDGMPSESEPAPDIAKPPGVESVTRLLRFEYDDGSSRDFELGKATTIRGETRKVLFHLDRRDDGKHLMLCAEEAWPTDKRIECIRVVRYNK